MLFEGAFVSRRASVPFARGNGPGLDFRSRFRSRAFRFSAAAGRNAAQIVAAGGDKGDWSRLARSLSEARVWECEVSRGRSPAARAARQAGGIADERKEAGSGGAKRDHPQTMRARPQLRSAGGNAQKTTGAALGQRRPASCLSPACRRPERSGNPRIRGRARVSRTARSLPGSGRRRSFPGRSRP